MTETAGNTPGTTGNLIFLSSLFVLVQEKRLLKAYRESKRKMFFFVGGSRHLIKMAV